jgi:hypothetical protein
VSGYSSSTKKLWRGFRRPVRNDKAFWVAIGLCLAAVAAEVALSAAVVDVNPIASVAVALLVVVVVFSVVGAITGMIRGFSEGFRHGPTEPPAQPEPAVAPRPAQNDGTESRPGGLPKSVTDLAESAKTMAGNLRKPTSADVDKGARTLGRAIGAARRAVQSPPEDRGD